MGHEKDNLLLALSTLGVVYGDIGTSPLYAMHASLGHFPVTPMNVYGVLSLICWSLIIIVSIKYTILIFYADNEGQGGIFALLALLKQKITASDHAVYWFAMLGAGLLIGDGMITPAISVSAAIEGINVVLPQAQYWIEGITCCVLLGLFIAQRFGSSGIGLIFGPIIVMWFLVLALLGLKQVWLMPEVLQSIHPYYAYQFLVQHGWTGYFLLGGVFLVVTGAEALYADIGHFGKQPIRLTWYTVVLPALLLNYFGQGALLLSNPEAIQNPFYFLIPTNMLIPLVFLATLATIIASQAIISATFTLMRQAILLGLFPRMPMIQTSKALPGQVYIPQMNWILMIGAILLVLMFQDANHLSHAYGISVNAEMLIVSTMGAYAAYRVWSWPFSVVVIVFAVFIGIDLSFLGANALKFLTGGWVPVMLALFIAFVMLTWRNGFHYLQETVYQEQPIIRFISKRLMKKRLWSAEPMTAVFIKEPYEHKPDHFLHFVKVCLAFAKYKLIISCHVTNHPYVHYSKRCTCVKIEKEIYELTLYYGFMEHIAIPQAVALAVENGILPFPLKLKHITYWVELLHVMPLKEKRTLWFYAQERFFAFLMRNYPVNLNIGFYRLPYDKTLAIGTYTVI